MAFEPVSPIDYRSLHVGSEWSDDDRLITTSGSGTRNVQITPVTVTTGGAMSGLAQLTMASGGRILNAGGTPDIGDADRPFGTVYAEGTYPLRVFRRNSNQFGPHIDFVANNSAGVAHRFADIYTRLEDYTEGAEDGSLWFQVVGNSTVQAIAGVDKDGLVLESGKTIAMDGNTVVDTNRLLNLRAYTVATLPAAGTLGRKACASDGRKSGEGAGAGTGVEVMDDGSQWYCEDTSSAVAA